jgi:hypothetical protein
MATYCYPQTTGQGGGAGRSGLFSASSNRPSRSCKFFVHDTFKDSRVSSFAQERFSRLSGDERPGNNFHKVVGDRSHRCDVAHLLPAAVVLPVLAPRSRSETSNRCVRSVIHGGAIVDATLIAGSPSTKNAAGRRDPEMRSSKKGKGANTGKHARDGARWPVFERTASLRLRSAFKELVRWSLLSYAIQHHCVPEQHHSSYNCD